VKGYSANTNQGITRDYNEDRVSVILNILKPPHREHEHWPNCSFFAVYDGHGGSACSDFLRDNLHKFVVQSDSFPWSPREALFEGMQKAESAFLEMAKGPLGFYEQSGSCAIIALIVGDTCHVANVGDSRAVLSAERGAKAYMMSRDHKPEDPIEKMRIEENGGQVYQ
jgi:protein phosphatase 2C family protein 2/3